MEELREVAFVLSRQLEIRLSNWKIPLSILPRMVESIPVILFPHVAHGRPQLVPSSVRPELGCGVRLLALWDHKGHVFVGFTIDCPTIFSWDMTADLDAIHTSSRFLHNLSSESTAGESFKSSTWINVSNSLIFSVASSVVWAVPLAVIITGGAFDVLNRSLFFWSLITFYSSYEVKLPSPQWILPLFRRRYRGWRCLAGRTWLEEPVSILRIRTWNFVQVCVKSKLLSLLFLPSSKSIRMIAFRCRWFWGPVWMTPRASPDFSLVGTYLFARCWSLTRYRVLSSDWTFRNYICQSSFDGMWITIDAEFHNSSAGFAVCFVCTPAAEFASTWSFEFCTFGNMPTTTWITQLAASCLQFCTR